MHVRKTQVNVWFVMALLVSVLLWRVLWRALVIVFFLRLFTDVHK